MLIIIAQRGCVNKKMVKQETKNDKTYFMCEECEFFYETKDWAEKCEKHCNEKHACSMEITKHAVQFENEK